MYIEMNIRGCVRLLDGADIILIVMQDRCDLIVLLQSIFWIVFYIQLL